MGGSGGHEILLVEDDLGDAGLVRVALRRSALPCRLHHVQDGVEAMGFLLRRGAYESAPRPSLVLLDLNLPGRNGLEILEDIRADALLRCIPVVVLSTSNTERDVRTAYGLGANGYVVKPMEIDAFTAVILAIQQFWLVAARLPG